MCSDSDERVRRAGEINVVAEHRDSQRGGGWRSALTGYYGIREREG